MRFRHPDGSVIHLGYCSNVHPAETVEGICEQLRRYAGRVRSTLGADVLGVGLWLPAQAAHRLVTDSTMLGELRAVLRRERLEVVTLNTFPYRGFHDPVVKRMVYQPDWSVRARLEYTLDCARVLAELLPDDVAEGSISTLPLGWRRPWYRDRDVAARAHLAELAQELGELRERTGRRIRVGLEPEPGCVLDTTADAVRQLGNVPGMSVGDLGVCVDTCHLATGFEDPDASLAALDDAGLAVVKAQLSAALQADEPSDPSTREALAAYAEDRFLHQVREPRGGSSGRTVHTRDDLREALDGRRRLPAEAPWRVHFHVPLHADPYPPLRSTREHLASSLGRPGRWHDSSHPASRGGDVHVVGAAGSSRSR